MTILYLSVLESVRGPHGKSAYPDSTLPDESMWTHRFDLIIPQEMSAGGFQCRRENLPEVKDAAGHNTRDRVRRTPKDRSEAVPGSAGEGTRSCPHQVACAMFMRLVAQLPNKPERFWSIRLATACSGHRSRSASCFTGRRQTGLFRQL